LKIQDEYNFAILEEKSTKWQTVDNFEVFIYKGALPKIVKLDEIQDYVFYHYNDSDFAVNGNSIFINENVDSKKTLQKVASDDSNKFSFEELWSLFEDNKKDTQQEKKEPNSNFLDDVNEFISELEGTEWNDFVSELKNILELSLSHQKEKQKLFNLIAKIKLAKELDLHFEVANKDYNHLESGKEKYFVHSARGAFAYIHPNEILKMKDEGYKMALDFSTKSRVKIYETAEEILQLNTNHILAYQKEKSMEDLVNFCQANRDANKHLLIIDKNNSGEKSRALLKLLNIEDEYQ
jgi:DNA-binding transcriptional regulator YhcF (GntR family)